MLLRTVPGVPTAHALRAVDLAVLVNSPTQIYSFPVRQSGPKEGVDRAEELHEQLTSIERARPYASNRPGAPRRTERASSRDRHRPRPRSPRRSSRRRARTDLDKPRRSATRGPISTAPFTGSGTCSRKRPYEEHDRIRFNYGRHDRCHEREGRRAPQLQVLTRCSQHAAATSRHSLPGVVPAQAGRASRSALRHRERGGARPSSSDRPRTVRRRTMTRAFPRQTELAQHSSGGASTCPSPAS